METTWIEIGGLSIRSPVTAGTNLLLSLQCLAYFARRRRASSGRVRGWGAFFALMALATLAGVFKHGARHLMTEDVLILVLGVSNVASAVAVHLAQEATITSHAPQGRRKAIRLLADVQLAAFLAVNLVFGPEIVFLVVNTAVGLVPVIAVEASRREEVRGGGLVASGLAVSLLTGLVYGAGLSLGPWLNHVDLAHLLMGMSFFAVHRGVPAEADPWT